MALTDRRRGLGKRGEELARRYLEGLGYSILEANYRCRWGEIDLVTRKGDCLVFVEVRTRRGDKFGTPEESVTPAKMAHVVAAAEEYLQSLGLLEAQWRIDLVAVEMGTRGRLKRIQVIENAVDL